MLSPELTQQHVLIVGDGSLFDEGITELLAHGTDMLISHEIYSDDTIFLNRVKAAKLDMVVVSDFGPGLTQHILGLISSHLQMMELPVIILHHYSNMVDLYDKTALMAGKMYVEPQQINITTGEDLLSVVRGVFKGG